MVQKRRARIGGNGEFAVRTLLTAALAAVVVLAPAATAPAQMADANYLEVPVDPSFADDTSVDVRRNRQVYDAGVRKVLQGEKSLSDTALRDAFNLYIRNYKLAEMTQLSKLGQLADLRNNYVTMYLGRAKDPAAKDHLLQLTFAACSKIATSDFHPAVRYNAMLLIGDLNVEEMQSGFTSTPPLPYPPARDFLVAELQKESQPVYLQVAILIGLLRHAEAERATANDQIPADQKTAIVQSMLQIANTQQPPEGVSADANNWLRSRAIDVLAAFGALGQDNAVFNAMLAVLDEPEAPLSLRCAAARGLGRLEYTSGAIDAVSAAQKVASLASVGTLNQLARIEEKKKLAEDRKKTAGPGMGMGMDMYGSGMDMYDDGGESSYGPGGMMPGMMGPGGLAASTLSPEDQKLALLVRRLGKYVAYSARAGMTGSPDKPRRLRPGDVREFHGLHAAAKDQAEIDAIDKLVDAVTALDLYLEIPDGDKVQDPADWTTFVDGVRTKVDALAALLPQPAAPESPDAQELPSLPMDPSSPAPRPAAPSAPVSAPAELPSLPGSNTVSAPGSLPLPGGPQ